MAGAVRGRLLAIWRFVPLVVNLLRRRDVALAKKAIPLAGLLYVLIPIDAIPDFIALFGQTDDGGVGIGSLLLFVRSIPRETVASTLDGMRVNDRVARGALMAVYAPWKLVLLIVGAMLATLTLLVMVAVVVL